MSKRKASYDLTFKLKAVKRAEETTKEAAAHEFKVDPRRIREWCQQKEKFVDSKKQGKSSRKWLEGGGFKADNEELEKVLLAWIVDLRSQKLRVSLKSNGKSEDSTTNRDRSSHDR